MIIKKDFSSPLFASVCLNPRTKDLVFGTNKYYSEYCSGTLRLNSIRFRSSTSPYFEAYFDNVGMRFSPKEYPSLLTYISTDGEKIGFYVNSATKKISFETSKSNANLILQNLSNSSNISLNTSSIPSSTKVQLQNIGLNNDPVYILANKNQGYFPLIDAYRVAYSDISNNSIYSDFTNIASYASYTNDSTAKSTDAGAAAYSSYADNVLIGDYANYANYASNASYANFAFCAPSGQSASYAIYVENFNLASVPLAGKSDYAGSTNQSSYALIASIANAATYATDTKTSDRSVNDLVYDAANSSIVSSYAQYASNFDKTNFAKIADSGTYAGTAQYIYNSKTGDTASYAIYVENHNQASVPLAGRSSYSDSSSYASNAGTASIANAATYATDTKTSDRSVNDLVYDAANSSIVSSYAQYASNFDKTNFAKIADSGTYAGTAQYIYNSKTGDTASYAIYVENHNQASVPLAGRSSYSDSSSYASNAGTASIANAATYATDTKTSDRSVNDLVYDAANSSIVSSYAQYASNFDKTNFAKTANSGTYAGTAQYIYNSTIGDTASYAVYVENFNPGSVTLAGRSNYTPNSSYAPSSTISNNVGVAAYSFYSQKADFTILNTTVSYANFASNANSASYSNSIDGDTALVNYASYGSAGNNANSASYASVVSFASYAVFAANATILDGYANLLFNASLIASYASFSVSTANADTSYLDNFFWYNLTNNGFKRVLIGTSSYLLGYKV